MSQVHKIFIIGGTGAQGIPVIQELVRDKKYRVRVLTRDTQSRRAKELASLPNVELVEGSFAHETVLRNGYKGCDGAFVNIDGFNTGEKTELYWGIRCYELAVECGIKFYVWGNLDYASKKGNYDPQYRCGHYDGKGRIGEWVLQQPRDRMGAALFTTGPYIDMTIASRTPMTPSIINGVCTWKVPLGTGAVPHIALEDCGYYVRWIFDNPSRSNGMDLEVATAHIPYADLASAFSRVTGHPAQYIDIPLSEYWSDGPMSSSSKLGSGYNSDPKDAGAFMTIEQNFTGFWNLWKDSGGNRGVIRRDYALLDEIHPRRIRSAEEWFRRQGPGLWERVQPGNLKPVLKIAEDGPRGRL